SSVHHEGRAARHLVEQARERVAALVGAQARNVIFTSGGTEANAMALSGALQTPDHRQGFGRLLVSAVEHASVRAGGGFPAAAVEEIPVTADGVVDLGALEHRLIDLNRDGNRPPLVSVMAANNETGVIEPVAAASRLVHAAGGLLHVDAVQAVGRIPFDLEESGADLVTVSAHKLGGPMGVGALIRRSEALHFAGPLVRGGGQERGARAGTENVAGIAGFGAAALAAGQTMAADGEKMRALRDRLEAGLLGGPSVIFGRDADRLPNTSLFAAPGVRAETALINLDLGGFAVSSGSACSSGKVTVSHVLAAMGVPGDLARGAIRVSIGGATGENDIDRFLKAWRKLVSGLSKGKSGIAA
ncbi:MAG: cysteine desulfurase, partial [Bradyrhizobiaceae bacterium]|nr:cysteine desulfurase [Bradyrhizobiaceae bacterium]